LEIVAETASPAEARFRNARTVPIDSVIVNESSVVDESEIINDTPSTADVGIGQRKQTHLTPKYSPTMSLFQLENHHQNFFPS
jgi:hypothetical protein